MEKLIKIKLYSVLSFILILLYSCTNEPDRVIALEISGTSSLNGTYTIDETHTKGPKYVNDEDSSKRLITYNDDGVEMWGLMNKNYLVYKIEKEGGVPPERDWECGVGVDKDKFRCFPIYGN